MKQYFSLAEYYDALNSDFDYKGYANFCDRIFLEYMEKKPKCILDLACGTGSLAIELSKLGYDLVGVDLSEEMLSVTERKFREASKDVLLTCQNMSGFELYGTVDAAVSSLDSVNYLTAPGELERCFGCVYNYLESGGIFVFDMNSIYKFENVYSDNAYVIESDGVLCAWQNYYNRKNKLCDFYLSIFAEDDDGKYERFDENQRQRAYTLSHVKRVLEKSGFSLVKVVSDFEFSQVNDTDERWFFIVQKR